VREVKTQHSALSTQHFSLSRFDGIVWSVIALLVVVILGTIVFANFSEPGARVAYLAPAYGGQVANVWIADPQNPSGAQQITFSPEGIYDFSVSPDGRYLSFSERNNNVGTTEIKLYDLSSGALSQLTNCVAEDADCRTPIWRPDGKMIAYERMELNSSLPNAPISPVRVWLIDLAANPPSNRPLFTDSQILGYSPVWSGDGTRIAVYDNSSGGILVYNFLDGSTSFIPSRYGDMGTLSPDGTQMVFPEMVRKGNQMYAHLRIANLASAEFSELTNPEEPVDDSNAEWNPDGERLAISRQYTDDRYTRGHQVYLLTPSDGTLQPLVVDFRYNTHFFEWHPDGKQLLMQRFPEVDDNGQLRNDGRPEIWTYDLDTGLLIKVATDAFQPRWVP
jgi:Tol biopolymer transport system component